MTRFLLATACAAGLGLTALPAQSQEPEPEPPPPQADSASAPAPAGGANVRRADEPRLVFEREVFEYPGRGRRDPFQPLTGRNTGPQFADLRLRMIIFDRDPAVSLVAVSDLAGNVYRLRRGDTVGNATVIDIGETRVIFAVNDFGIRTQQVMDIRDNREGVDG